MSSMIAVNPVTVQKTPVMIKQNAFRCVIYDIDSLIEFPITNLRKLWKIMFDSVFENELAIDSIRKWLSAKIAEIEYQLSGFKITLNYEIHATDNIRASVAAFGSVATKEQKNAVKEAIDRVRRAKNTTKAIEADHIKVIKLQAIFNEMATKARI